MDVDVNDADMAELVASLDADADAGARADADAHARASLSDPPPPPPPPSSSSSSSLPSFLSPSFLLRDESEWHAQVDALFALLDTAADADAAVAAALDAALDGSSDEEEEDEEEDEVNEKRGRCSNEGTRKRDAGFISPAADGPSGTRRRTVACAP